MTGRGDDTAGYLTTVEMPAVAAADTSTVVLPAHIPFNARVTKVEIVPRAAVTAHATHYGTVAIQNKGPEGTGTTNIATRSWAATNSVAGVKEALTLNATAANLEVKAGDQLQAVHATAGTGLALPAIAVLITYKTRR